MTNGGSPGHGRKPANKTGNKSAKTKPAKTAARRKGWVSATTATAKRG